MTRTLFLYLLGRLALWDSAFLLIPLGASFYWHEPGLKYFFPPLALAFFIGCFFLHLGREHKRRLSAQEGSFFLICVWLLLIVIGMLPFGISGRFTWIDAFFQSVSAVTTTGIFTIPVGNGAVPHSLLLWHSLRAWLGGLNFIVLIVTIIPQVSGSFGPVLTGRSSKNTFSPTLGQMFDEAHRVAIVYSIITVLSFALFNLVGLSPLDSLTKAFMAISTSGGHSSIDMAYAGRTSYDFACGMSMLLASISFILYWRTFRRRDWKGFLADTELRSFVGLIVLSSAVVTLHLWKNGVYPLAEAVHHAVFQVITFASTSGFSTTSFATWPQFDVFVLILLVFCGGCVGSVTGGLKVMRFIILFKLAHVEIYRTMHPRMVVSIRVDDVPVDMKVVSRVLGFFFIFMVVFTASMIIISISGLDPMQSMGVAVGCLTSAGVTANLFGVTDFTALPAWTKLYCCFLMVLGRMEVFSFLIALRAAYGLVQRKW